MKNLFVLFAIFLPVFFGCSLPSSEKATVEMSKYWDIYQRQQYDSLKSFYHFNEAQKESDFPGFIDKLKQTDERFGKVLEVTMTKSSATKSFGEGTSIQLEYEVVYEHAKIAHRFKFIDIAGVYKIIDHSFDN